MYSVLPEVIRNMISRKTIIPYIKVLSYASMLAVLILVYLAFINRIKYGIDLTDESWYVAEPYIVAKGAIPFVDNWTQAPGFALPLYLVFCIFIKFTGGTEGIVYFSRCVYAIVMPIVFSIGIIIIHNKTKVKTSVLALAPLMLFTPYSLYGLSYNTLAVIYVFISAILILFCADQHDDMYLIFSSLVSGMVMSRCIIASPFAVIAWAEILITLAFTKRWKKALGFFAGNVVTGVLVVLWCVGKGGIYSFLNGIRVLLTKTTYISIARQVSAQAEREFIEKKIAYVQNAFFVVLAILLICQIIAQKNKALAIFVERIAIALTMLNDLIMGIQESHLLFGESDKLEYGSIVFHGWYWSILIVFIMIFGVYGQNNNGNMRNISILATISLLFVSMYLVSSSCNAYGFLSGREYWLIIPTIIGVLSFVTFTDKSVLAEALAAVLFVLISICLLTNNYMYVYRDSDISELTNEVDSGIWKYCYTTEERSESVVKLEQYIKDITDSDDKVLFLDQVCFAYLMNDGEACTPTTSDPMAWTYNVNNYSIMEEYFAQKQAIPDKVIYINFGRDETLSVDSEWRFNDLLRKEYSYMGEYSTNPTKDTYSDENIYLRYYKRNDL